MLRYSEHLLNSPAYKHSCHLSCVSLTPPTRTSLFEMQLFWKRCSGGRKKKHTRFCLCYNRFGVVHTHKTMSSNGFLSKAIILWSSSTQTVGVLIKQIPKAASHYVADGKLSSRPASYTKNTNRSCCFLQLSTTHLFRVKHQIAVRAAYPQRRSSMDHPGVRDKPKTGSRFVRKHRAGHVGSRTEI